MLLHWRSDPDPAGVRDPTALASLPAPERDDWQSRWANVNALLVRARIAGL
jgi:hypothetical protein